MPKLVGALATPPPVIPPDPPPPVVEHPPLLDVQEWTWVDRNNVEWRLNDPARRYWILADPGVTGLGITPRVVTRDDRAKGGTVTRHEWIDGRLITFDMIFWGRDHQSMLGVWRPVGKAFRGGGILRVRQPDGRVREIRAELEPGSFTNDPGKGRQVEQSVVQLWCPDGYWRDQTPVPLSRPVSVGRSFLGKFMSTTSSRIPGRENVLNDGDAPTGIDWTIVGPASSVTAINHTTGEQWVMDPDWDGGGALETGETVTITSDPPTVTGPDGSVWWGAITGDLWLLQEGINDIEFTLAGTGAGSDLQGSYPRLWDTI